MKISSLIARVSATAVLAASMLLPLPSAAAAQTYLTDTTFVVKGVTVKIKAGSEADSFTQTDGGFAVTVAAGEMFEARTPYEAPMAFDNDAGLAACNVLQDQENQIVISGPRTVNVTLSSVPCAKTNYSTNNTTLLVISQPNGGETLTAGGQYTVFWQITGGSPASVRLKLSTDGGMTWPTTVFDNMISNGYYQWSVPMMETTTHARLKLFAVNQGNITAVAMSQSDFTVNGTAPATTTEPPTAYSSYDPATETANAVSIDEDRGFVAVEPPSGTVTCTAGTRIKGASSTAVYYCGVDHKRHPFPNERIYKSWFADFNGVATLTDADLAAVPLGANVTYRPGVRLVKITTDPKVYAVAKDGTLRWVPDEWTAKKLYGVDWNTKVDDVPDAFFFDYTIGEQLQAQI